MKARWHIGAGLAAIVMPAVAGAQGTNDLAALPTESATPSWSSYISLYGYLVPDSRDYVNVNFAADHNWLHLEARYNYEALETGSLWLGYNISLGKELTLDLTPMVGGVFGELTGFAPGYNLSLSYRNFSLESQGEFVTDPGDSSNNFFYTWSELTYSPVSWFRAGFAVQRTKAYDSDLDIQRGFLLGTSFKNVDFTTYVFNLGWTDPTIVLAIGVGF